MLTQKPACYQCWLTFARADPGHWCCVWWSSKSKGVFVEIVWFRFTKIKSLGLFSAFCWWCGSILYKSWILWLSTGFCLCWLSTGSLCFHNLKLWQWSSGCFLASALTWPRGKNRFFFFHKLDVGCEDQQKCKILWAPCCKLCSKFDVICLM